MREDLIKLNIGIILAIVGTGLTILKAFDPTNTIDYVYIVVGIGLIVVYCFLTWDWYERVFGIDASIALFTIPLITTGAVTIVIALFTQGIAPPHDKVMLGLGAALVIVPIGLLWKIY